ncbi:MAG: hypothetical protein DRG37_03375 [Deltaproteobacteria bacterium]|nr:MAG: hypothetical protein DRG37_03375 [Deltaproteobacteria bacterium]
MDVTKTLLIAQIAIQIVFLVIVLILILRERHIKIPLDTIDALKQSIAESRALSEEFSTQVTEKVKVLSSLMEDVETRIKQASDVKARMEDLIDKLSNVRTYTKDDVLKLHKGGFAPEDISSITGIPVGEIQLMLKVSGKE